ncbi:MAG: tetratricopeptide repeat protein [Bdellovibrionales bacterium]|nr:tetratricopeptide repeat protein [Bdellovibrionales bacterium]
MRTRGPLLLLASFLSLCVHAHAEDGSGFVGSSSCAGCHEKETVAWRGSHHDFSMDEASPMTVLADFNAAEFSENGIKSVFRRRGEKYFISTKNSAGKQLEYQVEYVMGFYPLQQYVVKADSGRYNVFSVAWDTRPKFEGGQRWFSLSTVEPHGSNLVQQRTSRIENWNAQCGYCHSTNFRKNFDLKSQSYKTEWSENNVACEACHGPGAKHLAWAKSKRQNESNFGLTTALAGAKRGVWSIAPGASSAQASRDSQFQAAELNTCATCHSKRNQIREPATVGAEFLDAFEPALLEDGVYHADGQVSAESFVWGSFLQSKMFSSGVTCSDCHDSHTLQLRAEGGALCANCHRSEVFDTKEHHFHEPGSEGAQCVSCHMPEKTFMSVDIRRDHSFRVPRPDLSIGSTQPNACTQCHAAKSAAWAAGEIAKRRGEKEQIQHYGEVFLKAHHGDLSSVSDLSKLISDKSLSRIIRATAAMYLGRFDDSASRQAIKSALNSDDALVRFGAAKSIGRLPADELNRAASKLLKDRFKAVRLEAAAQLSVAQGSRSLLDSVREEFVSSQNVNADQPASHLNLAWYYLALGQKYSAETEFKTAIEIDPNFVAAYVSLANFYAVNQTEERGETVLREGLLNVPSSAQLRHALGLLYVRTGRIDRAVVELGEAAKLAPGDASYAYIYAIALRQAGDRNKSIKVLEKLLEMSPDNSDALTALATINSEMGNKDAALSYAKRLKSLRPTDPEVEQLVERLGR